MNPNQLIPQAEQVPPMAPPLAGNVPQEQPPMGMGGQPMAANPLMPPPQVRPAAPQVSPEFIQTAHDHFTDKQQELDNLLKLPDSELNLKSIYGAFADAVTKNRLSRGLKGMTAMQAVSELSSDNFPKTTKEGYQPHPKELRKYLQQHFDKAAIAQAILTHKFGPPQSPMGVPGSAIPNMNNQIVNSGNQLT